MLVPKDPSLFGKTFEVDIVATGKHFMKGEVVTDSQVHTVPRPPPLPPGCVSGMQVWKSSSQQEKGSVEKGSMEKSSVEKGSVDISLLMFAVAILVVLLIRLIT